MIVQGDWLWTGDRTYEVDADGGDIAFCVGVIGESKQQTRLSDAGISNKEKLE